MVLMRASLETGGLPGSMLGFGFDPKIMFAIIGATNRRAGVFSLQYRRSARRGRSLGQFPLQGVKGRERRSACQSGADV